MNSGFQISLPEELMPFYINYDEQNPDVLKVPHITASLAEGTKASNTKNLEFKPLEKPIRIVGKFGYWIKDGNNEHLSYDPYSKNILYNIFLKSQIDSINFTRILACQCTSVFTKLTPFSI